MLCFWLSLSGFFNSDAGGRVIIIIIMGGCGLQKISGPSTPIIFHPKSYLKMDFVTTLVFSNSLSVYVRVRELNYTTMAEERAGYVL